MKHLKALIWHELTEGRMILLTAFVVSWLPIVAPWLPGTSHHDPRDVQLAVVAVLLLFLGTILVLSTGFSFIGRDLAERRFGFYLAQPIAGWILWLGKLLGAYALVFSALVLMLLPTAISGSFEIFHHARPSWFLLGLAAILLLLVLSHATSIMARDRTVWLLVDLISLTVIFATGWLATDRLLSEQANLALYEAAQVIGIAFLLALLLAGGAQVVHGRNDLARGHRFLSLTLWPVLISVALGFATYAHWLVTPSLADLERLEFISPAAQGPWLAVGGKVSRGDFYAAFLLNSESGGSHRLGSLSASGTSLTFAADGGAVVWTRCRRLWKEPCDLWWRDLDGGGEARELGIELGTPTSPLALSADGARLAVYQYGNLGVFSLPEGSLLRAIKLDRPEKMVFDSRDQLRLLDTVSAASDSYDKWTIFEVESGQVLPDEELRRERESKSFERVLDYLAGLPSESETRLLREDLLSEGVHGYLARRMYRMSSGELVVLEGSGNEPRIFILSTEGEKRELELPHETRSWSLMLGGEAEPGKLTIGWLRPETAAASNLAAATWSTHLLDVHSGELRFLASDAVPLQQVQRPSPGTPAMRILISRDALLLWDPERQEVQPFLTFEVPQSSFRAAASTALYRSFRAFYE